MTAESDSFDHIAVAADAEPGPALAEARAACPVAHSGAHDGFWALFSYDDIGAAARDTARYSSASGVTIPAHAFPMALPPIEADAPLHMQVRGPLLPRFSPQVMEALEDDLRSMVNELIDGFIEAGSADLATDLVIPFPGMSIGQLMAVPKDDITMLRDLTAHLMANSSDLDVVMQAMAFFQRLYEDRLANPGEDLPTSVLSLEIDGRPVTNEEYLAIMAMVMMAGLDTTANAAGNMLELIGADDDIRQALIADPAKIPQAVEEFLRYSTPLHASGRTATEDFEIEGCPVTAGDKVLLNWLAANHDPAEFDSPEVLDIERFPNRHFAFGTGPHRCLGIHLARLQLRVVAEEVLRRLPDYVVDTAGVERYIGVTRGVASLPVTFTPGPRSS